MGKRQLFFKSCRRKSVYSVLLMFFIVFFFLNVVGLYIYFFIRWEYLWTLDAKIPYYKIDTKKDILLRVSMIGDSWAGLHHEMDMDSHLGEMLEKLIKVSVFVESKGKGGEKTKGVYKLMFELGEYGTRSVLSMSPDYCIVIAGINDATANLGTKQYCHYYRQILDFLLANHIRPVIVEIPNVNIWHLYGKKPFRDLVVDFVRSIMTRSKMYQFQEYREALYQMLIDENLLDKVVYVPMKDWNEVSPDIDKQLFMSDQIHLNRQGYEKLDTCIALAIAKDLEKSGNIQFVE